MEKLLAELMIKTQEMLQPNPGECLKIVNCMTFVLCEGGDYLSRIESILVGNRIF